MPKGARVRRMIFILIVGLAQTTLFASTSTAGAQGMSFSDDFDAFDTFDTDRWSAGDHRLGRSYLDPDNVAAGGGYLRLKLPARTLEGAEVLTNELHGYGSYSARMKLPNAPSSITGFFLYKAPDYESEIDVEIFNDSTRRIMFTTYAGGRQTHNETMQLSFDPTTGFHEYRFDYLEDSTTGEASIAFFVDGTEMKSWDTGVPRTSMHLMLNSWFPAWLDGRKPKKNAFTTVDGISFEAQQ